MKREAGILFVLCFAVMCFADINHLQAKIPKDPCRRVRREAGIPFVLCFADINHLQAKIPKDPRRRVRREAGIPFVLCCC